MSKLTLLFDAKILANYGRRISNGVPRVADELLRRFSTRDDVEVHVLRSSRDKKLDEYLEYAGATHARVVDLHDLARTEKIRTFKHRFVYGKLLKYAIASRYKRVLRNYDVYFNPHYFPTAAIVHDSGIRTAGLIHDLIPIIYPKLVPFPDVVNVFPRYLDSAARSDVLFFISEYARADFLRCKVGFDFARTAIARPAVDPRFRATDPAAIRQKYDLPARYLFALSDEQPRKNFQHALDAFALYRQKSGDTATALVIGGVARGALRLPAGAKQLGYVPDEDLPPLYSGAAVFLYPSLNEGFGIPPLEAMACGTPPVVGNNSAMPEVCGDAALYVSGFDTTETSAAIDKVMNDPAARETLVRNGLARVARYSWDEMADVIISRLKNLCAGGRRP